MVSPAHPHKSLAQLPVLLLLLQLVQLLPLAPCCLLRHARTRARALTRSRIAAEVYERLSVAIQRANADGVISWRYSEYGSALHNSESDPESRHSTLQTSIWRSVTTT
jgi:hypothetical protein